MIIEEIKKNYPVIIFGSGPAGISLALTLEKQKINCLILEAGKKFLNINSQSFYETKIYGDDYGDTTLTRFRQFGGTGNFWSGYCHNLSEKNLENWEIKKKDLDKTSEEVCKILEIENNFEKTLINENFQSNTFQLSKVTFDKFFNKIQSSNYIDCILNTSLSDFEIDKTTEKIIKIYVKQKNSTKIIKVDKSICVICIGTIETCKFMLNLKLKNDFMKNYQIGNYLMDHPVNNAANGFVDTINFKKNFINTKTNFNSKNISKNQYSISPTTNFLEKNKILDAELILNFKVNFQSSTVKKYLNNFKQAAPLYFKKLFKKKNIRFVQCDINPEQDAVFTNRISLNFDKKDSHSNFSVKINWRKSENMRKTQLNLIKNLGQFFIEKNLGRIAVKNYLREEGRFIPNAPCIHHLGGTRMGTNIKNSVVNKNLQVHGFKNLYISSGSVFKSSGFANPVYTICQLSVRLGGYLSKKLV